MYFVLPVCFRKGPGNFLLLNQWMVENQFVNLEMWMFHYPQHIFSIMRAGQINLNMLSREEWQNPWALQDK